MARCFFGWLSTVCLMLVGSLVNLADVQAAAPGDYASYVGQPVVLALLDGRTPRGVLSTKSTSEAVVLVTEIATVSLESRFATSLVESINAVGDFRADGEQSPTPLISTASPLPELVPEPTAGPFMEPFPAPSGIREPAATPLLFDPFTSQQFALPDLRRAVRSLTIQTQVANWDRDAECDGLLVRVLPLDDWGQVVPVDGLLDVELVTETSFSSNIRVDSRTEHFRVMERWSTRVSAFQFDASGTVVKLPFRRFHPERDLDVAPDALATARLRLPSAGVVEASDPFVVLRPASRFRDQLQQYQQLRR